MIVSVPAGVPDDALIWPDWYVAVTDGIGHERPAHARNAGSPTRPGRNAVASITPPLAFTLLCRSRTMTSSTMWCSLTWISVPRGPVTRTRLPVAVTDSQCCVYCDR